MLTIAFLPLDAEFVEPTAGQFARIQGLA